MIRILVLAGLFFALLGEAQAERVVWPVPMCRQDDIATASPAPLVSDSSALKELPFVWGFTPATAGLVIGFEADGAPFIRCVVVDAQSSGLEGAAIVAVAGLKFAMPDVPNVAVDGGRYLVRVSSLFGVSWIRPPPRRPLLASCPGGAPGGGVSGGPVWFRLGPKPSKRIQTTYPIEAEREGIEGNASVRLEVYSNGAASPVCVGGGSPAGWFEAEAVRTISQWRFKPSATPGLRSYVVTIKFRLR